MFLGASELLTATITRTKNNKPTENYFFLCLLFIVVVIRTFLVKILFPVLFGVVAK